MMVFSLRYFQCSSRHVLGCYAVAHKSVRDARSTQSARWHLLFCPTHSTNGRQCLALYLRCRPLLQLARRRVRTMGNRRTSVAVRLSHHRLQYLVSGAWAPAIIIITIFTRAVSSGKRNVTSYLASVRPSVRLSVSLSRRHIHLDSTGGVMRRGQHIFRSDNKEDRHFCLGMFADHSVGLDRAVYQCW